MPDVYDINKRIRYDRNTRRLTLLLEELEDDMSVGHVTGLADIVKATKAALAQASSAALEMQTTAASVTDKVNQVVALNAELKAADAELGAAIGTMTNGAPPGPLPDTAPVAPPIPTSLQPAPQPQAQAGLPPGFDIHTRRDRPR